jgi:hypothetical protein
MTAPPKERAIGLVQFLAIIAVAVVIFIAWDFGQRVLQTMRLAELDAQAGQELHAQEKIHADLQKLKDYVGTDAYVEQYAREKWHWQGSNETLFVPIATPVPTPTPVPTVVPPTPAPKSFWQDLLDKIYGPAP